MCEIVMIVVLCIQMGKTATAKGRNGVLWGFLMAGTWIGCEVAGVVVGFILLLMLQRHLGPQGAQGEPNLLIILACGYGLAILGAVALFAIIYYLPDVRDDYALRDRGFDDRGRGERDDYRRRFGPDSERDDYSREPRPRPKDEDERYTTE